MILPQLGTVNMSKIILTCNFGCLKQVKSLNYGFINTLNNVPVYFLLCLLLLAQVNFMSSKFSYKRCKVVRKNGNYKSISFSGCTSW